jgi:hypothetical protein
MKMSEKPTCFHASLERGLGTGELGPAEIVGVVNANRVLNRPRRVRMKLFSTILAAALVAGSCTVAMAQASGGGAAGGDQSLQQGTKGGADKNPTGAGANPAAGNTTSPGATASGKSGTMGSGSMKSAPASNNTRSDSPMKPAGANDTTGAKTGSGGSK